MVCVSRDGAVRPLRRAWLAWLGVCLMGGLGGCDAGPEALQARVDTASWSFSGCDNLVLVAVSEDQTLALEVRLQLEASDLPAPKTWLLDIDGVVHQAVLYDGEGLADWQCDESLDSVSYDRHYVATEGQVSLSMAPAGTASRLVSVSLSDVSFPLQDSAVKLALEIEDLLVLQ